MSNVCFTPLNWIFTRGQGVKIQSLVAEQCYRENFVIPVLYNRIRTFYEGAVVLKPNPGIYLDEPVSVLDYASLYPSSIIENNLSHETYVTNIKYIEKYKEYQKYTNPDNDSDCKRTTQSHGTGAFFEERDDDLLDKIKTDIEAGEELDSGRCLITRN